MSSPSLFSRKGPIQRRLRPVAKRLLDHGWCGAIEYALFPSHRLSLGGPFNGQAGRAELFRELIVRLEPALIVETGTHRGTTTRYLATLAANTSIVSVEISKRFAGFARRQVLNLSNVRVEVGDSRPFLRRLLGDSDHQGHRILFFLDAHWGRELPLVEELETIFAACREAIVAIDDFEVVDDPGYAYDFYDEERALTASRFAPLFEELELSAFYPSLPSSEESGKRTGLVVVGRSEAVVDILREARSLRPVEWKRFRG